MPADSNPSSNPVAPSDRDARYAAGLAKFIREHIAADMQITLIEKNALVCAEALEQMARSVHETAGDGVHPEFERGLQIGKAIESAEGCICRGNWRAIIKDTQSHLDQCFIGDDGSEYYLIGILHASDDYYYAMRGGKHGLRLLSCVGSIEGFGFTRAESSEKSNEKPSASTDDHVTPSREPPPSSVECPECLPDRIMKQPQ